MVRVDGATPATFQRGIAAVAIYILIIYDRMTTQARASRTSVHGGPLIRELARESNRRRPRAFANEWPETSRSAALPYRAADRKGVSTSATIRFLRGCDGSDDAQVHNRGRPHMSFEFLRITEAIP